MIMFTDAEFMTAKEKKLVLSQWATFLKHGLQKRYLTKRLYEHLHLHCGYIVHCSVHSFYRAHFGRPHDILRFFDFFCEYSPPADYVDLKAAMLKVYHKYRKAIEAQAESDIDNRLELLEAYLERAKYDREFAKELLETVTI